MNEYLSFGMEIFGLDEDVNKNISKIEKQIPVALNYVGSEMITSLEEHLQEDWYNEYEPQAYRRRTDNPSLGRGLKSNEYIDVNVTGKNLSFIYTPSGEYNGQAFAHERDGDELIESIQIGSELWGNPPPRPFWNNFVEEQKNEKIMTSFAKGISPYVLILEGGEKDILFGNEESILRSGNEQLKIR